jgi:hypothetical protein
MGGMEEIRIESPEDCEQKKCSAEDKVQDADRRGDLRTRTNKSAKDKNQKHKDGSKSAAPSKRKRRLRKRTKSRGHGTLNEDDLKEPKSVDTDELNIEAASFEREFGSPGLLPEKYRALRTVKTVMKPKSTEIIDFQLSEGDYQLTVSHCSKMGSLIGASKSLSVKVWVSNTTKRYSLKTYTKVIRPGDRTMQIRFEVPKDDKYSLLVQFYSRNKIHTSKVVSNLEKKGDKRFGHIRAQTGL